MTSSVHLWNRRRLTSRMKEAKPTFAEILRILAQSGNQVSKSLTCRTIFRPYTSGWKSLDYVSGWFLKAAEYGLHTNTVAAFVSTNSICQGHQVPILWPHIFNSGHEICFAHTSFKWANLASHNAGVTVAIVGIAREYRRVRRIFSIGDDGSYVEAQCAVHQRIFSVRCKLMIEPLRTPLNSGSQMLFGNMPRDGGNLLLSTDEKESVLRQYPEIDRFVRPFLGSEELIQGKLRWCIWLDDVRRAVRQ